MGKKSRRKMLEGKIKKAKEILKKGTIIDEDDICIVYAISPRRVEFEPKNMTLKELQTHIVKKFDGNRAYRKAYKHFNVWVDENKNRVVLSR